MSEKTRRIKQLEIVLEMKRKNLQGMYEAIAKLSEQCEKVADEIGEIKTELSELRMENE